MRRKLKLVRIAEKIVGYHPKEVTNNFSYFVKKCLKVNPSDNSLGIKLFTIAIGLIYYWIPSCRIEPEIIYIPKIYMKFENIALGFLVHELLHLKHPEAREEWIHITGKEMMKQWRLNYGM